VARKQRLSKPVSLSELADTMGYPPDDPYRRRKLLRKLRRLEEQTGNKILNQIGEGSAARYFVTMAVLRENHPDFFYRRDEVVEAMREYVENLDDKFLRLKDEIDYIAERLASLEDRLSRVRSV
jgi:hypothetical protein